MFTTILIMVVLLSVILSTMMAKTQALGYEELIVVIDYAGRLMADDMEGAADVQPRAPAWAHGIEKIGVGMGCNGDALGCMTGFVILEGSCFPDGPHEVNIGASGGQDVDLCHSNTKTTWFVDMGIRVNPGGTYRIYFEGCGEDAGEMHGAVSLVFQSDEVRQPKAWIGFEELLPGLGADVQLANLAQVAAVIDPGASTEIGGIILASASDFLPLGCSSVFLKLSKGVEDEQQYLAGTTASELITAPPVNVAPSQIINTQIPVKKDTSIYVEGRMVGEDHNSCIGGSLGLVKE